MNPTMRSDGCSQSNSAPLDLLPLPDTRRRYVLVGGQDKVICTASIEDRVPPFRRYTGTGWVTANTACAAAPRARTQRKATAGRVGGRTQESSVHRRSLRRSHKLEELRRTITLACDVIQATRCADGVDLRRIRGVFSRQQAARRSPSHDAGHRFRRRYERRHVEGDPIATCRIRRLPGRLD